MDATTEHLRASEPFEIGTHALDRSARRRVSQSAVRTMGVVVVDEIPLYLLELSMATHG
jgi:hypothetical protein